MTKIAIVTGASRGLGRNTALHIARRGGGVILTYRDRADDAQAVVADIRALGRKALALRLDLAIRARVPAAAPAARPAGRAGASGAMPCR